MLVAAPLACVRLIDLDESALASSEARVTDDLGGGRDAGVGDAPRDLASSNTDHGLASDHTPDHAADATVDQPIAPDAQAADTTVDGVQSLDSGPQGVCGGSAPAFAYPGSQMVICKSNLSLSLCLAVLGCGGGLHVCTATEFRARGGMTTPAPYAGWLSSCTRNHTVPQAPSNVVCSCGSETVAAAQVSWKCSAGAGGPTSSDQRYLGVASHSECRRVGIDDPSTEAYWHPRPNGSPSNYVVCCP